MEFDIIRGGKFEVYFLGERFIHVETRSGILWERHCFFRGEKLLLDMLIKSFIYKRYEIRHQDLPHSIDLFKQTGYFKYLVEFNGHTIRVVQKVARKPSHLLFYDDEEIAQVIIPKMLTVGYQEWKLISKTDDEILNIYLILAFLNVTMAI